jgi:hypothetical protein
MSHLVAQFQVRVTRHKERLLREAQERWLHGYIAALSAALKDRPLVRLTEQQVMRSGKKRWRVNQRERKLLARRACRTAPLPLHSSARASLEIAIEQAIGSWAGLHCDWLNSGKPEGQKPSPPVIPLTSRQRVQRYEHALADATRIGTLSAENRWRSILCRRLQGKLLPMYFGAMTCGAGDPKGRPYHHHAGLLKRSADGRFFIALTLWPKGDRNRQPAQRARNRVDRGQLFNVRSAAAWDPARCESVVILPVEIGRGVREMFIRHGIPKSAELIRYENGRYGVHVAFELPEVPARELSGCILACQRGIDTLVRWVLIGPDGELRMTGSVEGRGLRILVRHIVRARAKKQKNGRLTTGDRRISRPVEHHLRSAARQLRSLAAEHGAEIVVLKDEGARKPGPFLRLRHWHELYEHLCQYTREAGLPEPRQEPIYGRWSTCTECGHPLPLPSASSPACQRCDTLPDIGLHRVLLLARQALRFRLLGMDGCKGKPLAGWLYERWLAGGQKMTTLTGVDDIELEIGADLAGWIEETLATSVGDPHQNG